jgi:hypothetical protein
MRGYEGIGCLLGKRFVGAWSLEKRAGRYGTVLYWTADKQPLSVAATQSRNSGESGQKQVER